MTHQPRDERRLDPEIWYPFNLDTPIQIRIAHTVLDVAHWEDMPEDTREGLNDKIPAYIYDRQRMDVARGIGFKALRYGEVVQFGRYNHPARFRQVLKDDPYVSRDHAQVKMADSGLYIIDKSSMNGTFVSSNGSQHMNRHSSAAEYGRPSSADSVASEAKVAGGLNQDAYFFAPDVHAAGVFDGVGSKNGSEQTSSTAAHVTGTMLQNIRINLPREHSGAEMEKALLAAHENITELGDVATTAVAIRQLEDVQGKYLAIGYVGDSRAYLLRRGQLRHLTIDDSTIVGADSERLRKQIQLANVSRDEDIANSHDRRLFRDRNYIAGALGGEFQRVHTDYVPLQQGDTVLLTTDGVHDNLVDYDIKRSLDIHGTAEALVALAKDRSRQGGLRSKSDDITAVVMNF